MDPERGVFPCMSWEAAQANFILHLLLELIICDHSLLTLLNNSNLISVDELYQIFTLPNLDRSTNLFRLVWNRENAFGIIKEALLRTRQHTAYNILCEMMEPTKTDDDELLDDENELRPCGQHQSMYFFPNRVLGKGSYNTVVYCGLHSGREVAIKKIYCETEDERHISSELTNLRKCDEHENILQYFDYHTEIGTPCTVYIALEMCDITLRNWVTGPNIEAYDPINVLQQATLGVGHLHHHHIVHRDLNPNNILLKQIDGTGVRVKIADFGISRELPADTTHVTLNTQSGTLGWVAPEVLSETQKRIMSSASDIFSLGCVYYFVLTKGLHLYGETAMLRQPMIQMGTKSFQSENMHKTTWGFLSLISMMTETKPEKRPTASDVLKHHSFWPRTLVLNFLQDLSNCLEGVLLNTTMDVCANRFESMSLTMPWFLCHQSDKVGSFLPNETWDIALCPVIRSHATERVRHRPSYDFTISCQLLRFIRNIYNHFATCPRAVRQALGSLPDQFLEYWLQKYPLLVDAAFLSFIEAVSEYQEVLMKYYTMSELQKIVNWRNFSASAQVPSPKSS